MLNDFLKNNRREHDKRYYQEHKKRIDEYQREYDKNHKQQKSEYMKKYRKKIYAKEMIWRKNNPDKIKNYMKKYFQSEKGKIAAAKFCAKRNRNKKWIQILPNIFPGDIAIEYHHVDSNIFVAPLPQILHRRFNRMQKEHINWANSWIEFYYGINPTDILKEDLCVDALIASDGLRTNEQ